MTNSKTYSVCDAYITEFTYYALEAPNSFIKLSKELFIENHGKPTQDLMFQLRLAKEALTNWNSDSAAWEKHQMVFPLKPQSDLQSSEVQPVNLD